MYPQPSMCAGKSNSRFCTLACLHFALETPVSNIGISQICFWCCDLFEFSSIVGKCEENCHRVHLKKDNSQMCVWQVMPKLKTFRSESEKNCVVTIFHVVWTDELWGQTHWVPWKLTLTAERLARHGYAHDLRMSLVPLAASWLVIFWFWDGGLSGSFNLSVDGLTWHGVMFFACLFHLRRSDLRGMEFFQWFYPRPAPWSGWESAVTW